MAKKDRKDAFLILRLPQELKDKIVQSAKEQGNTISEYLRRLFKDMFDGK